MAVPCTLDSTISSCHPSMHTDSPRFFSVVSCCQSYQQSAASAAVRSLTISRDIRRPPSPEITACVELIALTISRDIKRSPSPEITACVEPQAT